MSFVNDEKQYVATYKELILTFLVFCIILFVLYPKDLIKEQILSETSNYDLSMLYLKNMLKNDPNNESLMLTLASQSLRSGKKDLAYKLLTLLHNSKDRAIRSESYRQSYILAKEDYFYFEFHKQKLKQTEYYQKLNQLFKIIMDEHFYTKSDIDYLFTESLFLNETQYSYTYALLESDKKKKMNKLISLYFRCVDLKRADEAKRAIEALTKSNPSSNKWRDTLYYVIVKNYSKSNALKMLETKAKKSRYWKTKLAEYNFSQKEYREASNLYMKLFSSEKNHQYKKTYFFKAIESLNAGNYPKYAIALAKSQEAYYFNDTKMRKYILKLYLANSSLENAAALSKKILKKSK